MAKLRVKRTMNSIKHSKIIWNFFKTSSDVWLTWGIMFSRPEARSLWDPIDHYESPLLQGCSARGIESMKIWWMSREIWVDSHHHPDFHPSSLFFSFWLSSMIIMGCSMSFRWMMTLSMKMMRAIRLPSKQKDLSHVFWSHVWDRDSHNHEFFREREREQNRTTHPKMRIPS